MSDANGFPRYFKPVKGQRIFGQEELIRIEADGVRTTLSFRQASRSFLCLMTSWKDAAESLQAINPWIYEEASEEDFDDLRRRLIDSLMGQDH